MPFLKVGFLIEHARFSTGLLECWQLVSRACSKGLNGPSCLTHQRVVRDTILKLTTSLPNIEENTQELYFRGYYDGHFNARQQIKWMISVLVEVY